MTPRWKMILGAALLCAPAGCERSSAKPVTKGAEPPFVKTARPIEERITDYEEFTGRTDAVYSVDIRARVTGYLDKVYFTDGNEVKEGDMLFLIDPRPYEADLNRMDATLVQAEAHLKRLDADFRRASNLIGRGNISREEFDKISGDRAEAEAAVGIARSSRDLAKLNVTFTKITAPISGRLSRRLVDPGNLVKADETTLTSIVSLDPMYVYFDIDERSLLRFRRLIREGRMKSREEAVIAIDIGLSDEEGFPHQGKINFSDNRVDANTGTLRIRAVIENPTPRVFSPGLFVRVRLPVGSPHDALLVPEQALVTDQNGKFLYVVGKDNLVETRKVKLGTSWKPTATSSETFRVIEEGLGETDRVVIEGLQRVRKGSKVTLDPPKSAAAARAESAPGAPPEKPAAPKPAVGS